MYVFIIKGTSNNQKSLSLCNLCLWWSRFGILLLFQRAYSTGSSGSHSPWRSRWIFLPLVLPGPSILFWLGQIHA